MTPTGTGELIKRLRADAMQATEFDQPVEPDVLRQAADALEAAERERDAAYRRGYREAYDSGLKALADMGVEFSKLAIGVQEQLDLVKESAAGLVDIVEGRASSAKSLLDVEVPDEPGSGALCFFPATGKGGDEG